MSQASLEVVQAMWGAFLRGGFPDDASSDDVEWHPAPDEAEGGPDSDPVLPVDWTETHVYTVRDGRVCHVQEHRARGQALEAVGVADHTGTPAPPDPRPAAGRNRRQP